MTKQKIGLASLEDDDTSSHADMTTSPIESKLVDRMEGSRAEIVMMSVRMKKSERKRLKEICSQQSISAQDLVFQAVNLWCQAKGVRGLE
ncbi:hypothetical protein [Rhodoferax antarcticus]|uniref:hypothetical protein n=1 Tax=Rhodoferax antarcticus TaxID=81479 RepID=UPI00222599AC|nr:hypothetical protein [Rhodoferax antarcticus]MCW2314055.1 hypothetical protein [Rhodoferax antarcticus]